MRVSARTHRVVARAACSAAAVADSCRTASVVWGRRAGSFSTSSNPRASLPPHLSSPTMEDVLAFYSIVGDQHVITDPEVLAVRNRDWLKQYFGRSPVLVRPGSTAEVSAILRHCNARRLPVVPQGGNTGLVGGGVPLADEVILSLERLTSVSVDADSGVVVAGAGCVLQALDGAAAAQGLMMPLDLGSKGSCMIGGNVSTNAGGLRLLRWGSLHGSVLGVEAVLADGTVVDALSVLRKDNVGYDVKQLFIGSEGTLGVVTKVAIQAVQRPRAVNVALFGLPDGRFDATCVPLLRLAREGLGEILSAVEFVDRDAMELTLETLFPPPGAARGRSAAGIAGAAAGSSSSSWLSAAASPPPSGPPQSPQRWDPSAFPLGPAPHAYHVVVETAGSSSEHDAAKLHSFLEAAMAAGLVREGVVASDAAQARHLWRLREDVSVALTQRGHVFKMDLSFPHPRMYDVVEVMRERLERKGWREREGVVAVGYGHLGDGNVHLNVSTPGRGQAYLEELGAEIEPFVYEWTIAHGGSVSAEHGLGQAKANWLDKAKPSGVSGLVRLLKTTLDPNGILNPGKVVPL
jgi:D-2-hydroxyglutarate dehydrogenase